MGFAYYGPQEKMEGAKAAVEAVLAKDSWADVLRVYYRTDKSKPYFQVVTFREAGRDDSYWIPEQEG